MLLAEERVFYYNKLRNIEDLLQVAARRALESRRSK